MDVIEFRELIPFNINNKLEEIKVYYSIEQDELLLNYKTKEGKIVKSVLPIHEIDKSIIINYTDFYSEVLRLVNKELLWLNTNI
jgi:hypothetical protein